MEFALLVTPFLWLLLGTIEISLAFAGSSNLEGATMVAARFVQTGQAQTASSAEEAQNIFENALCEEASFFVDCEDLMYEVVTMGDGGNYTGASQYQAPQFNDDDELLNANGEPGNTFSPGNTSDVVIIRVFYNYQVKTPIIGYVFGGEKGTMRFMSSVVMQTEPYEFPT